MTVIFLIVWGICTLVIGSYSIENMIRARKTKNRDLMKSSILLFVTSLTPLVICTFPVIIICGIVYLYELFIDFLTGKTE